MAGKKKTELSYTVTSANTGAHCCGPYRLKGDAEHECARLNREAAQAGYLHLGEPVGYELLTEGGVVIP